MRTQVMALSAAALMLTSAPMPAAAQSGSPLGGLFSCDAPGKKDRNGAIIGALGGALVGSQISKNERGLGAVIGAGLGAAAGNYVGCKMNRANQAQAQGALQAALDSGREQTWYDNKSGASGRVQVISTDYGPRDDRWSNAPRPIAARDLRYERGVEPLYRELRPTAPNYVSTGAVNVRAAPSTSAPVVRKLGRGESVSIGGEADAGWLAVVNDGWVQGYVSSSVVRVAGGYDDRVARCRVVEQTLNLRGERTEIQRYNACRDDRGEWRVNNV